MPNTSACSRLERVRPTDGFAAGDQILPHHHRMDHVSGVEAASTGDDRFSDSERPLAHRFSFDITATGPLYRAGDSAAHPKMIVRGIDDGINSHRGNITDGNFYPNAINLHKRLRLYCLYR